MLRGSARNMRRGSAAEPGLSGFRKSAPALAAKSQASSRASRRCRRLQGHTPVARRKARRPVVHAPSFGGRLAPDGQSVLSGLLLEVIDYQDGNRALFRHQLQTHLPLDGFEERDCAGRIGSRASRVRPAAAFATRSLSCPAVLKLSVKSYPPLRPVLSRTVLWI